MPFIPHTPEALLPRSDSKNPATTCKGITSSGRPCRRALASPKASRRSSASALGGVLAVAPHEGDGEAGAAAAFFCWQHKDQAERLANTHAEGRAGQETAKTNVVPLQERSSIDTLVARLGVLEVEDNHTPTCGKQKRERRSNQELPSHQPSRRVERPPTWDSVRGPLTAVSEETVAEVARPVPRRLPVQQPARRKNPGFWASLCCFGNADDDYIEVVRHRKRIQPPDRPEMTFAPPSKPSAASAHRGERRSQPAVHDFGAPSRLEDSSRRDSARVPAAQVPAPTQPGTMTDREPSREKPVRPLNHQRPSETTNLLSLIPHHLSPHTTSALLSELAKPISPSDDEGYIYIFWLTDSAAPTPPSDAASSLLSPSSARPGAGRRRVSDVLSDYSSSNARVDHEASTGAKVREKTILLKIGRASNVHRRLSEWTRQCGYSLSLVRFYPYVPTSPATSPLNTPTGSPSQPRQLEGVRKVPHTHRVERLIHIELADKRRTQACEVCGKDHREWFEVEASRKGIREVNEVVRRWVSWSERADAASG